MLKQATNLQAVDERLSVPNLQRGLAILEYLAQSVREATLTELAETLEISNSSVYRITGALVELGYLARDPQTKRFSITNKLLLLGQPQGGDHSLTDCALEGMRAIRNETGETTQLCCLVELESVVLDQLLATHPFKYAADLGARCPCYSCAPGKAMLAFLPEQERNDRVARIKFKKFTETTLDSKEALQAELDGIRADGFAVDRGEGLAGIHCVAAPVLDRHDYPVAAITIAGPAARIPESKFAELARIVVAGAEETALRFSR